MCILGEITGHRPRAIGWTITTVLILVGCSSGGGSMTSTPTVATVNVSPTSSTIAAGSTTQLIATPKDASGAPVAGETVNWNSSSVAIVTVSATGLVTGVAAGGPVTITATASGVTGSASVTVTAPPVASVMVTPISPSIQVGSTVALAATLQDAHGNVLTGRSITWMSSNVTIASVDASGMVTGVAVGGPVTVTATSEGISGTASVTVNPVPVATVVVTPTPTSVQVAGTIQLSATTKDGQGNVLAGRVVTWQSSDITTATVSNAGLVTGVKVGGPVTITATSEGIHGTSSVTVTGAASGCAPPITVTGQNPAFLSVGGLFMVALASDHTVRAWGTDLAGQLGDGGNGTQATPIAVAGVASAVLVTSTSSSGAALLSDGTVSTWGSDVDFDMGVASAPGSGAVQVPGLTGLVSLTAGTSHMLALRNDGSVWAWGNNFQGELGDGTLTSRPDPRMVPGLCHVVAIAATATSSLALKDDGTVWAWGDNVWGELGDGLAEATRSVPAVVPGLPRIVRLASSGTQANTGTGLAIAADSTVWGWGYNAYGQLAVSPSSIQSTPVQAHGIGGVVAVTGSGGTTLALRMDGTVWAWGNDFSGQLGDGNSGSVAPNPTPVQVPGLSQIAGISASSGNSAAYSKAGTVWTWGSNGDLQLGPGRMNPDPTPAVIAGIVVPATP